MSERKESKTAAAYSSQSNGGECCRLCTMFRKPSHCTAVAGVVSPTGYCKLFQAKAQSERERDGELVGYLTEGRSK